VIGISLSLWAWARRRRQAAGTLTPQPGPTVWGQLGLALLLILAAIVFLVVTNPSSPRDFRGLYVAGCLVVLGGIVVVVLEPLWWAWRKIRSPLRRTDIRLYPPAEWEERVAKASPEEQVELLTMASLGSLGLGGRDLLVLLERVETPIKHEPALSHYWR